MRLYFEILFEVIFAELIVQFQDVIELLHLHLVATPEFIHLVGRHQLDVVPLLLQLFEGCITLVCIFRTLYQLFQLFNDGKLLLKVLFLQLFLLCQQRIPFLLDVLHHLLVGLLVGVGCRDKVLFRSSVFDERFAGGISLSLMQFVEVLFQEVQFSLVGMLDVLSQFFQTFNHFGFG